VPNSGQERPHSRAGREVSGGYNGLRLHCYRLFGGPRHVGGETYNKAVPLILHNEPFGSNNAGVTTTKKNKERVIKNIYILIKRKSFNVSCSSKLKHILPVRDGKTHRRLV
jgi:hypothetical protein